MLRAYQSPSIATDCGPQCAQMPNLASRNHSGHSYCLSDCMVGSNGPGAISNSANEGPATTQSRTTAARQPRQTARSPISVLVVAIWYGYHMRTAKRMTGVGRVVKREGIANRRGEEPAR